VYTTCGPSAVVGVCGGGGGPHREPEDGESYPDEATHHGRDGDVA